MKVISLRQPWAYLLCSGIKDIENRTWKLPEKYRGERVLIHASTCKNQSISELLSIEQLKEVGKLSLKERVSFFNGRQVEHAIIGSVRFVDCVINHESIWAEKGVYNWVLANPILFDKPILNVKGKLGFWDYDLPEEYETILNKALGL